MFPETLMRNLLRGFRPRFSPILLILTVAVLCVLAAEKWGVVQAQSSLELYEISKGLADTCGKPGKNRPPS